jgi:hypothetical protein
LRPRRRSIHLIILRFHLHPVTCSAPQNAHYVRIMCADAVASPPPSGLKRPTATPPPYPAVTRRRQSPCASPNAADFETSGCSAQTPDHGLRAGFRVRAEREGGAECRRWRSGYRGLAGVVRDGCEGRREHRRRRAQGAPGVSREPGWPAMCGRTAAADRAASAASVILPQGRAPRHYLPARGPPHPGRIKARGWRPKSGRARFHLRGYGANHA